MHSDAAFTNRAIQVADYLEEELRSGDFGGHFPSERALAASLGTSRRTVRGAIRELQRRGVIAGDDGALTSRRLRSRTRPISIGVVVRKSRNQLSAGALLLLDLMRRFYEAQNIRMEIHRVSLGKGSRLPVQVRKLTTDFRHDGWILLSTPPVVTEWFFRSRLPVIIHGMGDLDGRVSSISVDCFASCRHAAGEMLRLGHRRLAILLAEPMHQEDEQSWLGLQAAVQDRLEGDAEVVIAHHDTTKTSLCRAVDRLLLQKPRPTAWIVARTGHFFTVFSYLQKIGVRVPEDVSLISRESDAYVGDLVPAVARYEMNVGAYAKAAARLMLRVIANPKEMRKIRIIPEFFPGETLGRIAPSAHQK